MKLITWNIAGRERSWRHLLETGADIALLQEATEPPADVAAQLETDTAAWRTGGVAGNRPWRTAVVNLSGHYATRWLQPKSIDEAGDGEFPVSRTGTLAAASVTLPTGEDLILVSAYSFWESPHSSTGSSWIYADASAHRNISDISTFIGRQRGHQIIVAGDFNILHGYGEEGSPYWASRYETVFSRMDALGLKFVGPQAPDGRVADPWPDELPNSSKNVPTFHTNRQTPATATRQLDFVFASDGLAENVRVTALNEPESWGPSDHCCVEIEVGELC
jgi:endonuclease/exonuclease/phosphatase family metal-dependent hydrolase